MKIHYNRQLKERARELRKNSTLAEVLLWQQLKGRQMLEYDFHRQKPIDKYIVDFFCPKLTLIIEIDGETHNDRCEKDRKRQQRLESLGFQFLRFLDTDVKQNINGVILTIKEWIKTHTPKSPPTHPCTPLNRGDRGDLR